MKGRRRGEAVDSSVSADALPETRREGGERETARRESCTWEDRDLDRMTSARHNPNKDAYALPLHRRSLALSHGPLLMNVNNVLFTLFCRLQPRSSADGISAAPTVTDDDLDRHVAQLILKRRNRRPNDTDRMEYAHTSRASAYISS